MVMRMKRARSPDAVGLALFEHFVDRAQDRGVRVIVCGVRDGMFAAMQHCGLAEKLGAENVFREEPVRQTSTLLAIRHAATILGTTCPHCGGTESGGSKQGGLYYVI